jgi:uncharacterized damage-inducible protein DinB
MISTDYVHLMARYNRWQNRSLYGAAATLSDADRRADLGAFFGSIHATLSHLLWGDQMWMNRFAATGAPAAPNIPSSRDMVADWDDLSAQRQAFDEVIVDWAAGLDPAWLDGDLTWYSGASGREMTKPKWVLVAHMFNHQTHHRGQVHALLTRKGAKPDATDLGFMPSDA